MQENKKSDEDFIFWPQTIDFTAGTVLWAHIPPPSREIIRSAKIVNSKPMLHRPMAGQQALNL
jgi:hypothetical protein